MRTPPSPPPLQLSGEPLSPLRDTAPTPVRDASRALARTIEGWLQLGVTRREAEALALAEAGLSAPDIAARLGTSPRTTHKQLQQARAKLTAARLAEARDVTDGDSSLNGL